MKTTICNLFLLVFIVLNGNSQDEVSSILSSEISNPKIVEVIEKNIKNYPNNFQMSLAIVEGDSTKYIGVIRKNDTLRIVDNKNKVFEIGSITKVFTNILFSHFVNEKLLSLDDSLQNQFSFKLNSGGDIKLIQLANHTSGLARLPNNIMLLLNLNQDNPYKYYTPELLETYLKKDIFLQSPSGEKNAYSNLGTGLLGYILTQKTGKTYEELLHDIIFNPLGMDNSSSDLKNIDPNSLIKGLGGNGEIVSNWDFTDALIGAGGIKSSILDMEKFLKKNFDDDVVYSLTQQPTFQINDYLEIGLGWHISKTKNSKIHWHNGGTGGYRSCITINTAEKKGVIVLSNISAMHRDSSKIDTLCFQLLKAISNL